jgi:hypothetical protein
MSRQGTPAIFIQRREEADNLGKFNILIFLFLQRKEKTQTEKERRQKTEVT